VRTNSVTTLPLCIRFVEHCVKLKRCHFQTKSLIPAEAAQPRVEQIGGGWVVLLSIPCCGLQSFVRVAASSAYLLAVSKSCQSHFSKHILLACQSAKAQSLSSSFPTTSTTSTSTPMYAFGQQQQQRRQYICCTTLMAGFLVSHQSPEIIKVQIVQ